MTELETVVLGVIWLRGPLTAYAVRRELGASPGAIYPLLRRLEEEGLIRVRAQTWGKRGKSEYSIAPRGVDALRRGKNFIEAALAELDARRKWLTQIARGLETMPSRRRRASV
jgi:DNA-binding PadR family transcriptional regulator